MQDNIKKIHRSTDYIGEGKRKKKFNITWGYIKFKICIFIYLIRKMTENDEWQYLNK